MRVVDMASGADMQLVTSEMLVSVDISATDPRVIVFITRVAEVRVPLKHGHVFAADAETVSALKAQVDECLTLDAMAKGKDAENAVYYSPTAGLSPPWREIAYGARAKICT